MTYQQDECDLAFLGYKVKHTFAQKAKKMVEQLCLDTDVFFGLFLT